MAKGVLSVNQKGVIDRRSGIFFWTGIALHC